MLGDTSTETGDEDNDRPALRPQLYCPRAPTNSDLRVKMRSNMYPNFLYIGHFHNDLRHGEGVLYRFAHTPRMSASFACGS